MPLQFLKALMEIVLTVLGIEIVCSPEHPSKAEPPKYSNPSFNDRDVRPVQSSKAELPIYPTVAGIDNDVMPLHL